MEVPEALVSGVANASLAERKPHKLITSVETPLHALQTGELAMRPLRTADRHPPRVSPLSVPPPAPFERKQSHTRTMISSAGQARAFACDCLRWAERTDETERREILLNMTRQWSEIANSLDRREALIEQWQHRCTCGRARSPSTRCGRGEDAPGRSSQNRRPKPAVKVEQRGIHSPAAGPFPNDAR